MGVFTFNSNFQDSVVSEEYHSFLLKMKYLVPDTSNWIRRYQSQHPQRSSNFEGGNIHPDVKGSKKKNMCTNSSVAKTTTYEVCHNIDFKTVYDIFITNSDDLASVVMVIIVFVFLSVFMLIEWFVNRTIFNKTPPKPDVMKDKRSPLNCCQCQIGDQNIIPNGVRCRQNTQTMGEITKTKFPFVRNELANKGHIESNSSNTLTVSHHDVPSELNKKRDALCYDDENMIFYVGKDFFHKRFNHFSIGELALDQYGNLNSTKIYHSITSQEWKNLGFVDPGTAESSSITKVMADNITSILYYHITKLPVFKRNGVTFMFPVVNFQLRNLVVAVKNSYGPNHFHSFHHAYQVFISMNKLIDEILREPLKTMYGVSLSQEPLIVFTLLFGALIHDAGHTGMSNQILKEQKHALSAIYNNKDEPIAERYSLDLALKIFNQDEFKDLRNIIVPRDIDKVKFCKALFQSVLITDITSKERNQLSIKRYELTFTHPYCELRCQCECCVEDFSKTKKLNTDHFSYEQQICPLLQYFDDVLESVNISKSIALNNYPMEFKITHCKLQMCVMTEHLMLLSDVGHLMQGWSNFVKWNFRLYKEIESCHKKGLCGDPSSGWYEGQIGFFDFYIIPLARRGSFFFSASSFGDELVEQAKRNKEQWIKLGERASNLMINAVINNEEEHIVLRELYDLAT